MIRQLYIGFVDKKLLVTPPKSPLVKSPFDRRIPKTEISKLTALVECESFVYGGNVIVQWCYSCENYHEYRIMGFLDPRWHGIGGCPWFIRGDLLNEGRIIKVKVEAKNISRNMDCFEISLPESEEK